MSQLISARLPDDTAERLRQYARRKQRSVNETLSLALEEWIRQNEFAYIEFRDTPHGRMAYMKASRLPVWWVVKLAKSYGMDAEKTAAYWGKHRTKEWVQAALNYYEAFPAEIEALIADHEAATYDQLKRRLPQLERIEVGGEHSAGGAP
jgi:predicted DNA-binding protein